MIKLFLFSFLLLTLSACSGGGGGGGSKSGSPSNPQEPSSITLNVNLAEDSSQTLSLVNQNTSAYTYNLTSSPLKGTLSGTAPFLTYTSFSNVSGYDSFSYQLISNNSSISNKTVTVNVNIAGVNDRPVANNLVFFVQRANSLIFNLTGSDPDGDALRYRVSIPVSKGVLSQVNGSQFGYDADNEIYSVSFSYVVNDGSVDSLPATVTLHVTKINRAPVLNSSTNITMLEDAVNHAVTLNATDPDGDPLSASVLTVPTKGTLSGTYPNYIYNPNPNVNGSDSFKLRINDAFGGAIEPTFNVTITSVNDVPVANNVTTSVNSNAFFKQIILTGSDPDLNQTLSYTLMSFPAKGTVDINSNGIATYNLYDNQSGSDTFTYRISDGISISNTATVTVLIDQVINPPVAYNDNINAVENNDTIISVQGFSIDSNLTYEIIESPTKGILSGTGPNYVYKSNIGATGNDFFSFRIKDSQNQISNVAGVVISIGEAPILYNGFHLSGVASEEKFLKDLNQSVSSQLFLNLENSVETSFSWLIKKPNVCLNSNSDNWNLFQVGIMDQETDLQQKNFSFQSLTWVCDTNNKMTTASKEVYSDGDILLLSELTATDASQIWIGFKNSSTAYQANLSNVLAMSFNKVFYTDYAYIQQSTDTVWIEDTNVQGEMINKNFIKLLGYSKRLNESDPESQVDLYSQLIDDGFYLRAYGLFYKNNNEMIQILSHTNVCPPDELECVEETIALNQNIGFGFNTSNKLILSMSYYLGEIFTDATAGDLSPDSNKDNDIRAVLSKQILIYEDQ